MEDDTTAWIIYIVTAILYIVLIVLIVLHFKDGNIPGWLLGFMGIFSILVVIVGQSYIFYREIITHELSEPFKLSTTDLDNFGNS